MDTVIDLYSWLIYGLVFVGAFCLLYKHLTKNFSYFKKLGIKGPKPVIIFGNLLDLLFVSKPDLEVKRLKQFGTIYGIFEGNKPLIQVAEPELIKQILVTDFRLFNTKVRITNIGHPVIERMLVSVRGDAWRRTRTAVSPAFAIGRMRRQYAQIRHCVGAQLVNQLQTCANNCAPVDVKRMYGCFTLSAMTWCAFGARTDPYRDFGHPFVANAWPVFKLPLWKLLALQVLPRFVLRVLRLNSLFNEKCIANITQTILKIMRAKESAGDKSDDFINVVMNSKLGPNEELPDDNNPDDEENLVMRSKTDDNIGTKKSLTEEEIVAQGFIFFTAAFDQMANLLSFITYELALKPEAQDRLYEEIAAAVDADGEIGYNELSRLPYMDAVVNETLRLHAAPVKLRRTPGRDFPLGDTGIVVPRGQPLEIPIYAIHHSDKFYPNADQFIPDRFLPENRHNLKPYTFMPFSTGPRVCVGKPFALMEAKLALVHVLRRFRFAAHKDTKVPPIVKTHPMMKSLESLYISVEARD